MKTGLLASLLFSASILMLQQAAALRAESVAYDPTQAFSTTAGNPNGVWSYGWMPVNFGSFNLLTNSSNPPEGSPMWRGWNYDGTPGIWRNTGAPGYGVPTGWLSLHPGPGQEPMVLRWTAPTASPVTVVGQFLPGDGGSMQVAVRLNDQPWWSGLDSGDFAMQTNVVAGSTIDFTVYGGYAYGNTPLTVIISTPACILHLSRQGESDTVRFTAPVDGSYTLQFATNLAWPIQWADLMAETLLADQVFTFTRKSAGVAGFYRARRE